MPNLLRVCTKLSTYLFYIIMFMKNILVNNSEYHQTPSQINVSTDETVAGSDDVAYIN